MASRPFIPVPGCLESEVAFTLGSVVMVNRWFWSPLFSPFVPGDDLTLAGALGTWVINRYLPVLADNVLLQHTRARFLDSNSDPWATVPYFGFYGSYGANAMPANVTFRVRHKKRAFPSRQRPYICVPAPPLTAVIENEITDGYWVAVRGALSRLYDLPGLSGAEWSWVSFQHDNAWRSEGLVTPWGQLEPVLTVSPRRRRLRNTTIYPP